jgi:hypothetical protein
MVKGDGSAKVGQSLNYCDLAILSERDLRDRENYGEGKLREVLAVAKHSHQQKAKTL